MLRSAMPELPEVEAARRLLERVARGRTIERLRLLHPALRRRLSPRLVRSVRGARIERVERRGKHQLLHLDDGRDLHVHFRMSGDWEAGSASQPLPPHTRALLDFSDGTRLALVDPRALSTVALHRADDAALPPLGLEPTDPALTATALGVALAKRRAAIKVVLLDQRVVAGMGNIYAAEALWQAHIDPRLAASSLGSARRARLLDGMRAVIERALRVPGRDGEADAPAERFDVYDREGEPCRRCGASIRRIVQAGRSTYYCPRCQRR
jgi:formamidopyrimidine-DNA glycosylase